jgi:SAM-dependent methyltransferase
VKIRDSGMPAEEYWESLLDVDLTLRRLGIDKNLQDVAELGSGYGTFSLRVARAIAGTLYSFDIDPAMISRTIGRTRGLPVHCLLRDVLTTGFGVTGMNAVLLFNILHGEQPVKLLTHAADACRFGGYVLVTHWRHTKTPRGPALAIRPKPENIIEWAEETGWLAVEGGILDLPPWHYGLRLVKIEPR